MSTFEFDDSSLADLGDKSTKVDTADVGPKPTPAAPAATPAKAPAPDGRKQIYTMLARQGIDAAEVVNAAMQKRVLGSATPRRVEVIAPHGPSTSGGKKARQSITLSPTSGQGASIVFGFLDVAAKSYEVRPYQVVTQQYRQRFGDAFDASNEDYDALARDLGKILGTLGFKLAEPKDEPEEDKRVGKADEAEDEDDVEYEEGGTTHQQKLILLGVGVVATIVATLWWLK